MQSLSNPALPPPVEVIAYRHETPLFWISAVLAVYLWLVLIVATLGVALPVLLLLGLLALFAHSLLIAWVKGNAVHVTAEQFPDLHALYQQSCARLGIAQAPELYLAQADGMLNALATRFMRRDYVVLMASVVDALAERPEAIKFYMGHELGHVKRKHLSRHWWLWPALAMPLIAPAYSRACEYTCDRHGLACCNNLDDARRALAVLVAGQERWQQLNLQAFAAQSQQTGGFWMAVNELTADYPWLCKRMVVLEDREARFPRRSVFAWLIAALSPRLGYGGAVIGMLYWLILGVVVAALVGTLAFGVSWSELGERVRAKGAELEQIEHPDDSDADEGDADADAGPSAPLSAATLAALAPTHTRLQQVAQAVDRYRATHPQAPDDLAPLGLDAALTEGIVYQAINAPQPEDSALFVGADLCPDDDDCTAGLYLNYDQAKHRWQCLALGVPKAELAARHLDCTAIDD